MASMNPFDLLGGDDNDDLTQLVAAQPKKLPAAPAAAAAAPKKPAAQPAKLPSKPLPPTQAGEPPIPIVIYYNSVIYLFVCRENRVKKNKGLNFCTIHFLICRSDFYSQCQSRFCFNRLFALLCF